MSQVTDKVRLTVEIDEEESSDHEVVYVAHCLDPGISSQGVTRDEALQNVGEAVQLWLETASASEVTCKMEPLTLVVIGNPEEADPGGSVDHDASIKHVVR